MFQRITLLLVLLACCAPNSWSKNSFLVAPGRVDFDLNRPTTQSFIITNNGDGPIRLSIEPIYLAIDSKSMAAGEHLKPETAALEDLTQYVKVSPRRLSLNPGQRRDIRISLRPPANITDGDYRTHLLVSMMEVARTIKNDVNDENAVGMELNIKMETAVAVYGHKGERQPKLDVGCNIEDASKQLNLSIVNPSVWRFDGFIQVFKSNGPTDKPLYENRLISLRESKKSMLTRLKPTDKGPFLIRTLNFEDRKEIGSSTCTLP